MKICTKCKHNKKFNEFHKCKDAKSGLYSYCKPCARACKLAIRNTLEFKAKRKIKRSTPEFIEKQRIYNNNPEVLKKKQIYSEKPKNKEAARLRHMKRYNNEPEYKIKHSLRGRLYTAIKSNYKTGSAVQDLGCSIEELKRRLESQFQKGMTWDNYGEWHIDHIRPLASFDLTKREELLKACNYSNLQPLWAKDNLSKGATWFYF